MANYKYVAVALIGTNGKNLYLSGWIPVNQFRSEIFQIGSSNTHGTARATYVDDMTCLLNLDNSDDRGAVLYGIR